MLSKFGFNRIVFNQDELPLYVQNEANLGLLHFIPTKTYLPITYSKLLIDIIQYAYDNPDAPVYSLKELDEIAIDLIQLIEYGLIELTKVK